MRIPIVAMKNPMSVWISSIKNHVKASVKPGKSVAASVKRAIVGLGKSSPKTVVMVPIVRLACKYVFRSRAMPKMVRP